MILMELSEYEELKGQIPDKESAFEKGQIVALAYIADCIGVSVAFSGVEGIIRKIESGRKLKRENIKLKPAPNSIYTKIKECKL